MKQNVEVLLRNITLVFTIFLLAGMLESCSDKDDIIEEEASPSSPKSENSVEHFYSAWRRGPGIEEISIYRDKDGNDRKVVNWYFIGDYNYYYGYSTPKDETEYIEIYRNGELLKDFVFLSNGFSSNSAEEERFKIKLVHLPSRQEVLVYDFADWTEGKEVSSGYFLIYGDNSVELVEHEDVINELFEWKIEFGISSFGSTKAFYTTDGGMLVRPLGRVSGKRSIMPLVFVDEEQPDEYILLSFSSCFLNKDWEELRKDAEFAFKDPLDIFSTLCGQNLITPK